MSDKKPISLVITDIDNTLADKFGTWGNALDKALDKLAALYGRDRDDISKDLLAHVPDSMKHISGPYIGKDLRSDVALTPSLKPTSPEMEQELEKIFHEWDKERSKAELYEGVAATINKIKASGAKVVLYTDSRESVCIPRLAKMGITADMIDGLYVLPDLKDGQIVHKPVKGKAEELRNALGDKLVILEPKTNKPNPKNMQRILDDMGIEDPSTAVMVGDNIRSDGTAAITLGMNYAWQKGGTVIDEATNRCYRTFCQDPNYKLTTEEHLEQMNDTNRPTEVLESFKDLTKFYRFMSKEKALEVKTQAQTKPAEKVNPAFMKKLADKKSR
ncbi:MAG: HAD hydrolase-like protein [Alphaproteobacteria bacterium]|nr:HAD hydrolase-like protein [Alphaproteobacteria bacterium]